jgi:hypothetical protein
MSSSPWRKGSMGSALQQLVCIHASLFLSWNAENDSFFNPQHCAFLILSLECYQSSPVSWLSLSFLDLFILPTFYIVPYLALQLSPNVSNKGHSMPFKILRPFLSVSLSLAQTHIYILKLLCLAFFPT